jgi:hypothetical protein
MQEFLGSKFSPSEIVALRVAALCIRVFSVFSAHSSTESCPYDTFASADNVVCGDSDFLGSKTVSLYFILFYFILFYNGTR